ncbi:MAG: hypothetical protein WCF40_12620 [Desulfobacterales bacterium]
MVIVNFGRNSIAIIYTQYLSLDFGLALNSRAISYVVNTMALAVVVMGWTVGRVCRRRGNGAALLTRTAASIVALMLLAGTTKLQLIDVSFFLRVLGEALIMAAAHTIASVLIPPRVTPQSFTPHHGQFRRGVRNEALSAFPEGKQRGKQSHFHWR